MHILNIVFKTTCCYYIMEVHIMEHKRHIKEPGSAITHFIGMLMAIFAAVPLLIKAAHEPSRIYIIRWPSMRQASFYYTRQVRLIIHLISLRK